MSKTNMHLIDSFRLFLTRKGNDPHTIKMGVEILKRFLESPNADNPDGYFLMLIEDKKMPTYLNTIVSVLRKYGQMIEDTRFTKLRYFTPKTKEKAIMSKEEIMAFLNLEPPKNLNAEYTWHYKKMSLYWLCVAMSGARTSEIANLTINRVDFGQQVFKVIGKMGERKVPIKSILFEPLQEHIKQLKGEYLFPSMRTPRPIEKATWNLDFNKRIKRLGIKRDNLTPYSLRHSFATRNWRNMSLAELQKILGHRNISTTLAYTHLVVDDMIDAIKRDSLGMEGLDFNSRFKLFRDDYRKLLQVYAFSPLEEKEFIKNLL